MPNQFDRRMDTALLAEYMERGPHRDKVLEAVAYLREKPGMCLVPSDATSYYMRVAGKLKKFSIRTLVYYAMRGEAPLFHQCSCKNNSCINPWHQTGPGVKHV